MGKHAPEERRARAAGERSSWGPRRRAPVAARCCASGDASTMESKPAPYDLLFLKNLSPAEHMESLDELCLNPLKLPRSGLCIISSMALNDELRRIPDAVEPSRDLPWLSGRARAANDAHTSSRLRCGLPRRAAGERSSWGPRRRAPIAARCCASGDAQGHTRCSH